MKTVFYIDDMNNPLWIVDMQEPRLIEGDIVMIHGKEHHINQRRWYNITGKIAEGEPTLYMQVEEGDMNIQEFKRIDTTDRHLEALSDIIKGLDASRASLDASQLTTSSSVLKMIMQEAIKGDEKAIQIKADIEEFIRTYIFQANCGDPDCPNCGPIASNRGQA